MGKKQRERAKRRQKRTERKQKKQKEQVAKTLERAGPRTRQTVLSQLDLHAEIEHVLDLAWRRDARVVAVGSFVLFSTDTGDAWLLDPGEGLAVQLASDGARLAFSVLEADSRIAVSWQARFAIDGIAFVVADGSGSRVRTITGYEGMELIADACRQVAGGFPTSVGPDTVPGEDTGSTRRRKNRRDETTDEIDWSLATEDVPVDDVLEEFDLDDPGQLEEALDSFCWFVENGHFLTWEALIREEQDLPLSDAQHSMLAQLINFGDDEDDDILYINEMGRPAEAWFETLRKLVPRLLLAELRTDEAYYEVQTDGWDRLQRSGHSPLAS